MSKCIKCKVELEDSRVHCPLCGRCVDAEKGTANAPDVNECYPKGRSKKNVRLFVTAVLLIILFFATISCFAVEVAVEREIAWSWFVLSSAVLVAFGLLLPLRTYASYSVHVFIFTALVCGYFLILEMLTVWGWGLQYVVPFVITGISLGCVFPILLNSYHKWQFLFPLIEMIVIGLILFLVTFLSGFVSWPSLISLVVPLLIFFFILIFKFRKSENELRKRFYI